MKMKATIYMNGRTSEVEAANLEIARIIGRAMTTEAFSVEMENGDFACETSLENELMWDAWSEAAWSRGDIPATCCPETLAFGWYESAEVAMSISHRPCYKCYRDECWYEDDFRLQQQLAEQAEKYGYTAQIFADEEARDIAESYGVLTEFDRYLDWCDEVERRWAQ
jgi:hypothetical protein